jgi:hypothetical protein
MHITGACRSAREDKAAHSFPIAAVVEQRDELLD